MLSRPGKQTGYQFLCFANKSSKERGKEEIKFEDRDPKYIASLPNNILYDKIKAEL